VGKAHRQEVHLSLHPANHRQHLAKINLGMNGRIQQRNEHSAGRRGYSPSQS
jgi:hypothetical protein